MHVRSLKAEIVKNLGNVKGFLRLFFLFVKQISNVYKSKNSPPSRDSSSPHGKKQKMCKRDRTSANTITVSIIV